MASLDLPLADAIVFPKMPKSICHFLAVLVKAYLYSKDILNYNINTFHTFKKLDELSGLISHIVSSLTETYNATFAREAQKLINISLVNKFIKADHAKFSRSAEQLETDKQFNAQKSAAARARQKRTAEEASLEKIAKTDRKKHLEELALAAESIVTAGKAWIHLLFYPDGSEIEKLVLLSEDERNLKQLKTDIEAHLDKLRGKVVNESTRCLEVVVALEKILPSLRTHSALKTLDLVAVVPVDDIPPGPVAPPSKKKIGGQKNVFRWTSLSTFAARKGGLKVFNQGHKSKMIILDKNLKKMKEDLTERVHLEEDAVAKQKLTAQNRRIGLKKTTEQAKIDSMKPTLFSELASEELTGMSKFSFSIWVFPFSNK